MGRSKEFVIPAEGPIDIRLRLRAYRIYLGINQNEVARCYGCGQPYISGAERLKHQLSSRALEGLTTCLGTTIEELNNASNEQVVRWSKQKEVRKAQAQISRPQSGILEDLLERTRKIEQIQAELLSLAQAQQPKRPNDFIPS